MGLFRRTKRERPLQKVGRAGDNVAIAASVAADLMLDVADLLEAWVAEGELVTTLRIPGTQIGLEWAMRLPRDSRATTDEE